MYIVTAYYAQDGNILDCSQAEVLGKAFGKQYATEEEAREVAEELQNDVEDAGLEPTTTYVVESRTGTIQGGTYDGMTPSQVLAQRESYHRIVGE